MKRFSDLWDIKHRITVVMCLRAMVENGVPRCCVSNNDIVYFDAPLRDPIQLEFTVNLLDTLDISVSMSDKVYCQHRETAVILDRLQIDDLEIVPDFLHLITYENDHGQDIKTNYLGFNGVWKLSIPEPFYRWRHRVTGQGWLLEPTTTIRC